MNNRQWKSLGLAYFALVALLTPTLASAYIRSPPSPPTSCRQ